jgi:WD40 repeat protein
MEVGPLDQEINRVVWDPHHPKYISCASGNNIYTWDTRAKSIAYSIEETHLNSVLDMDYNPNKPYCIVTGGDEGKMKFWDLRSPQKPLLNLNAHTHWVWSVRYNRFHDQLVLSSSSDTLLSLWRVSSISSAPIVELDELETASADVADTKIRSYEEHEDSIYSIAWGSSDSWLFGALSNDGCFTINLVPSTEKYKILL